MAKVQVPEVLLNSGHKMPMLEFGTASYPLPPPDQLLPIFLDAMEIGYRHFDTAAIYGSEEPLGRAVAQALERGFIKSRDEVFITSKLWCTDAHHELVLPALKETLRKLGLSYVDLYLIHWPVRIKHGVENLTGDDMLPFDIKGTWEGMENCCKLGLAKSVGISNFSCAKLSQLLQHATISPAVNQVEMHVAWRQQKMLQFCKERGIHVTAWSPLGANGSFWGTAAVMESPILKTIAAARKSSVAQVALRWISQKGASAIVKSFNKERMKENLQILDWELSDEEMGQIEQIPQKKGFKGDFFVHPNGNYKSFVELWDGEHEVSNI